MGTGPSQPCHSPPKSASASRRRKNGSTSAKLQPGLPSCAQPSYTAGAPRSAKQPFVDEHPPISRARGSAMRRPSPSGSAMYPQSCAVVGPDASSTSGGTSAGPARSGPASSRTTWQPGSSLSRAASTHPAEPPPATSTSAMPAPLTQHVLVAAAQPGQEPGLDARAGWDGDLRAKRACTAEDLQLRFQDLPAGLHQTRVECGVLPGGGGQVPAVDEHVDEPGPG